MSARPLGIGALPPVDGLLRLTDVGLRHQRTLKYAIELPTGFFSAKPTNTYRLSHP
jgi:hypothetical protein